MSTFLVMAVSMKKLPVCRVVRPALRGRLDMVNFEQISITKEQSTDGTASVLSLEQERSPFGQLR